MSSSLGSPENSFRPSFLSSFDASSSTRVSTSEADSLVFLKSGRYSTCSATIATLLWFLPSFPVQRSCLSRPTTLTPRPLRPWLLQASARRPQAELFTFYIFSYIINKKITEWGFKLYVINLLSD